MALTSQVTMAWNGRELLVEAANPTTGAREKLAVSISDLPLEIQIVLKDNLRKAESKAEQLSAAAKMREERFAATRAREAQAAVEAQDRWAQYLSNLAPHVAAFHEYKKAQRIEKSKKSHEIYNHIASTKGQGIEFANDVIEPARRPRKVEMTKNGAKVTYYPRTDDNETTKKAKAKAKKAGVDLGILNTKSFVFNRNI